MPSMDRAIVRLPSIFACYWCSDYLQSLLVIGVPSNRTFTFNLCLLLVFRFSSLFLQNKKVQFNFVTHLSLLFVYLLYFKIAMDNPIYIYIYIYFFLLEFLEISCLSNLNCHYLLSRWVGVASLFNVFILCNCHYLFFIVFIKIFLNKLNVKTQPIGTLFFVDPNSHTHP